MFKRSVYNIEIDKLYAGDILLYNSYSTALGVMNKETQDIYYNIENIDIIDNKVKDVIDVLKNNDFIVDDDIDEYKRANIEERLTRYNNTNLYLTIAPTMNCNMACPYCYEDKSLNSIMSNDTRKHLVEFVKKSITTNNIKKFSVVWYGGEPLLEKETIENLSKEFISICQQYSIDYSASIVTNGILLDNETAKMLKENCNINSVQITIDGLKDTHNKRRILKNGKDSFEILTTNIENVKELLNIVIRINVDRDNLEELTKLLDYFIDDRKWGNKVKIYFYPIVKQTNACKADINNCFSQKEFGTILKSLVKYLYDKGNNKYLDYLYPKKSTIFCTATSINSFVIDPKGDLYTCWDLMGIKDRSIGNIKQGPTFNKEYLEWLLIDISDECNECTVRPICNGGCPLERLKNKNKPMCIYKIASLNETIKATYKESKRIS